MDEGALKINWGLETFFRTKHSMQTTKTTKKRIDPILMDNQIRGGLFVLLILQHAAYVT